jgi:ABC-type bacteriocin/lantibiotic exporter with double-glycine peptidase domain
MKKIARANVPGIRQQTQYTCMAASVAACGMCYGKDVDENSVNVVLGASAGRGARWEEALAALQYFGLRGHLVVPATLDMLRTWTDKGYPVMIAWNPEGRPWSHASVVVEVDGTSVHVMDPNCPDPRQFFRVVPIPEFMSKWSEKFNEKLIIRRPALVVTMEVSKKGVPLVDLESFIDEG